MALVAILFLVLIVFECSACVCHRYFQFRVLCYESKRGVDYRGAKNGGQYAKLSILAVPFFVLAGNLMNATGITKRLVRFSTILTGHLAGGLALVSCVLSHSDGRCFRFGMCRCSHGDTYLRSSHVGQRLLKRLCMCD